MKYAYERKMSECACVCVFSFYCIITDVARFTCMLCVCVVRSLCVPMGRCLAILSFAWLLFENDSIHRANRCLKSLPLSLRLLRSLCLCLSYTRNEHCFSENDSHYMHTQMNERIVFVRHLNALLILNVSFSLSCLTATLSSHITHSMFPLKLTFTHSSCHLFRNSSQKFARNIFYILIQLNPNGHV